MALRKSLMERSKEEKKLEIKAEKISENAKVVPEPNFIKHDKDILGFCPLCGKSCAVKMIGIRFDGNIALETYTVTHNECGIASTFSKKKKNDKLPA